jgi:cytochrome c oxidase cbb3-type subunit 3
MRAAYRAAGLVLLLSVAACDREERSFRADPVATETEEKIALVPLSPGTSAPVEERTGKGKEYENNAYHLAQGKTLYTSFNCNGCHSNGGGGSGPPLMDDQWIYGSQIENIVHTIREGRPNGMPSFRGRIPDDQIWELAAYVRALGGLAPKSAAPGRNDDMHPHPAENRESVSQPVAGGMKPPATQMPQ